MQLVKIVYVSDQQITMWCKIKLICTEYGHIFYVSYFTFFYNKIVTINNHTDTKMTKRYGVKYILRSFTLIISQIYLKSEKKKIVTVAMTVTCILISVTIINPMGYGHCIMLNT
jgi:hypothetical protein